jgi:hypothetical protein
MVYSRNEIGISLKSVITYVLVSSPDLRDPTCERHRENRLITRFTDASTRFSRAVQLSMKRTRSAACDLLMSVFFVGVKRSK